MSNATERLANEKHVQAFLEKFHESSKPDWAVLMEYFADDAHYQPLVPMRDPVQGKKAISAELERQYQFYKDCECVIHSIGSGDSKVFTERTDTVTLLHNGQKVAARLNAVFDIATDGRIKGWREYYDSGDMQKQLGVTAEQWAQIMTQ
ncbi:MAG: hypothetical protein JWM78_3692 [Verrucomicrobiaceae bacterium]|nr:hypothetical protein [Verrucomicrobiaceae bacterium]